MKKKGKVSDYVKANRKGSREAELEISAGWTSKTKIHKSRKQYNRKGQNWKNDSDLFPLKNHPTPTGRSNRDAFLEELTGKGRVNSDGENITSETEKKYPGKEKNISKKSLYSRLTKRRKQSERYVQCPPKNRLIIF
ncbi:MAG: hypothetical protein LBQ70_01990 [Prevotellaceae bacterium]|nr:hypothetical protein [Prevotellaceae bacterium]